MDSWPLHHYASKIRALPQDFYPVFDVCHIILCVLAVRKETGRDFSRKNPFATWLACIASSFAGSLIANPLLGKPILSALSDEYMLMLATIVYFIVFFGPADLGHTLMNYTPVYVAICVLKEILRAKKILGGLKEGLSARPDGSPLFVPVIVATIKGNGSGFMTPITRLIRGTWQPFENEVLKPSVTTKLCFFTALVFSIIGHGNDFAYLCAVSLFVLIKLSAIFGESTDPFKPFENAFFNLMSAIADGRVHHHKD